MIHCNNCGQENPDTDLFCRRCGISFSAVHSPRPQKRDFEKSPPGPYSWATGEFKEPERGARATRQIEIGDARDDPFITSNHPAIRNSGHISSVYRCPHCGTTSLPIVTKKVSSAGWIVFSVLLVLTLFLFWIGLLMQEEVRICSVCKRRVG